MGSVRLQCYSKVGKVVSSQGGINKIDGIQSRAPPLSIISDAGDGGLTPSA